LASAAEAAVTDTTQTAAAAIDLMGLACVFYRSHDSTLTAADGKRKRRFDVATAFTSPESKGLTSVIYKLQIDMISVRQTDAYAKWFKRLRDLSAKARIDVRIRRLSLGNPGDVRSVGEGVSELRIDYGPGYRVYFAWTGAAVVVLLCGGDKGSQSRDITTARRLARELRK